MLGMHKNSNSKLKKKKQNRKEGIEPLQVKHSKRMKGRRKGCSLLILQSWSSEVWGLFLEENIFQYPGPSAGFPEQG